MRPPATRRHAFTLLEAILALLILSGAFVACLQARAQLMTASRDVEADLRATRNAEDLVEMLTTGVLPDPELDEDTGAFVWTGTYLDEPYRITRAPESVPNPVAGQLEHAARESITLFRYEITLGDRAATLLWRD